MGLKEGTTLPRFPIYYRGTKFGTRGPVEFFRLSIGHYKNSLHYQALPRKPDLRSITVNLQIILAAFCVHKV
jgi:hypothetical protein